MGGERHSTLTMKTLITNPDGTTLLITHGARYQSLASLDVFQRATSRFHTLGWIARSLAKVGS